MIFFANRVYNSSLIAKFCENYFLTFRNSLFFSYLQKSYKIGKKKVAKKEQPIEKIYTFAVF